MSDLGDSFRESRARRQKARRQWSDCEGCGLYSNHPVEVPPGGTCHRCGWQAPEQDR